MCLRVCLHPCVGEVCARVCANIRASFCQQMSLWCSLVRASFFLTPYTHHCCDCMSHCHVDSLLPTDGVCVWHKRHLILVSINHSLGAHSPMNVQWRIDATAVKLRMAHRKTKRQPRRIKKPRAMDPLHSSVLSSDCQDS